MADHEVRCFARALGVEPDRVTPHDLIGSSPTPSLLAQFDLVLIGGSGDFSVAHGGDWLEPALDSMRELHARSTPVFASCWGFQAMAKALGGTVITDMARAEVGTVSLEFSEAGVHDPVFSPSGTPLDGQSGHVDVVDTLPEDAQLLASTSLVTNHAYHFPGKPIYCTQFHPELTLDDLLHRLRQYTKYVKGITGLTFDDFVAQRCRQSPKADHLLSRFVDVVFD
jgi:GMP synthase (glutamine-hydrolysing)